MPIYDQGYRHYQGGRAPRGRAWAVIAAAGLRSLFRRRAFLALLLLSWFPFLVRAIQIYAAATLPQARFLAVGPGTFRDFLDQQGLFVFFVTVYAGAGLIANDRRANALQIYLSKPLTRAEYVVGKLAVLAAVLLLVTWVPAVALLIVDILFTGDLAFLQSYLYLFPAITLFSVIEVAMIATVILALSSLSKSSRYVAILYAALFFFSQALYGILRFVTGGSALSWVSYSANLSQIGDVIFRLPPQYDTPWPVSLFMIAVLIAASVAVLARRVRGVEVVA